MDRKSIITIIILIAIVVFIIFLINNREDDHEDNETFECIAENSLLFVKQGCPACASQKEILREHLEKFNITDCAIEPEKCNEFGIIRIPTWIIDGKNYVGVHSIEEIKELTGC